MIIAASTLPDGGTQLAGGLIAGPAPSCVSLSAPPRPGPEARQAAAVTAKLSPEPADGGRR
jgi:hypothetical protein